MSKSKYGKINVEIFCRTLSTGLSFILIFIESQTEKSKNLNRCLSWT